MIRFGHLENWLGILSESYRCLCTPVNFYSNGKVRFLVVEPQETTKILIYLTLKSQVLIYETSYSYGCNDQNHVINYLQSSMNREEGEVFVVVLVSRPQEFVLRSLSEPP